MLTKRKRFVGQMHRMKKADLVITKPEEGGVTISSGRNKSKLWKAEAITDVWEKWDWRGRNRATNIVDGCV